MAITYDVEIRIVGGSATRYSVSTLYYDATGLDQSEDYEWRVREVDTTGGVLTWSAWTSWQTFSTTAESAVEVTLGVATETDSALSVTPSLDQTAPVITLLGSASVVTPLDGTYTDAGATASDNVDGEITIDIVVTGTVDTSTVGEYTLSYDVSDAAGNAATTVQRTVRVAAEASATSYNLEWREEGGSTTQVTGITDLYYDVTSLDSGQLHEYRVQGQEDGGAVSEWSAWTEFTTQAVGVSVNLGVATEANTALSVTPDVEIAVSLGIAAETDTAPPVTASVGSDTSIALGAAFETDSALSITAYVPTDQDIALGVATEANTALDVAADIGLGLPTAQADAYDLELREVLTGQITAFNNIQDEFYDLTSLTEHNDYEWRVQARASGGAFRSDWTEWQAFITDAATEEATTLDSTPFDADCFYVDFYTTVTANNATDLFGFVNDVNASVFVEIAGETIEARNYEGEWVALTPMFGNRAGISIPDELAYPYGGLLAGDQQDTTNDGVLVIGDVA